MSRVSLRNVTKRYGLVLAVSEVSFEVADAEFLAILGPSGCGKTTLMRIIAGLESLDAGEVCLGDRVVNSLGPAQRNVAMAFENYGLYPHWSVFQNIAYPLWLRNVPADKINSRVAEVAKLLAIDDILPVKPATISGGAKQRVGLARALVRSPDVFLLDEPMSHVDPDFRSQMRIELKRIQRELGGTFIYVTHDQLEAMSMADRILIMRDGVIQQIGTPHEVFNRPVNEFVAGFVGDPPMNFIPTQLSDVKGEVHLALPNGGSVPMPGRYRSTLESLKDTPLVLGVRPHNIRIGQPESGEGGAKGSIYVIEPLGDYSIITIKLDTATIKVEAPPDFSGAYDQPVEICFSPEKALLFGAGGHLI